MGEKISPNPIPSPHPSLHPFVLLAPDSINPHLLNKRRTLTLLRAMEGYGGGAADPMEGYGGGAAAARSAAPGDGWVAVAPPQPPEAEEEERFRGWEMVADGIGGGGVGGGGSFDDCAIFPPSLHEGLHLRAESNQALVPLLHQEPSHPGRVEEEELEEQEEEEEERGPLVRRAFSDSARRIWDSGIEVIQSKFSLCGGVVGGVCAAGAGVWSVAAMSVFAGVLMYMRRRDRRERDLLLLLVQEKEKKRVINHLAL